LGSNRTFIHEEVVVIRIDLSKKFIVGRVAVEVDYGTGRSRSNRYWYSPYEGLRSLVTKQIVLAKLPTVSGFRPAYWEELVALSQKPIQGPLKIFSMRIRERFFGGVRECAVLMFVGVGNGQLAVHNVNRESFPENTVYALVRV